MKSRIIVGLTFGAIAVVLTLIIKSESMSFNNSLYESSVATAIFALLNLPVLIVLMVTRIDYPPVALLLIFIQWFILGFLGYWALTAIRGILSPRNT